jgi:hypothetical protein
MAFFLRGIIVQMRWEENVDEPVTEQQVNEQPANTAEVK